MLTDFKRAFILKQKKPSRIMMKLFLFWDWNQAEKRKLSSSFLYFVLLYFCSVMCECVVCFTEEKFDNKTKRILSISSDLIKTFRFLLLTNAWLVISLRQVFFMPLRHVLTAFLIVFEKCDLWRWWGKKGNACRKLI